MSMVIQPRLQHALKQKLVMSQQLRQAIHLLQLNHMELVAEVQREMVENPTLEEIPGTQSDVLDGAGRELQERAKSQEKDTIEQNNGAENPAENVDWERYLERFQASAGDRKSAAGPSPHDDLPPIETNLTRGTTLPEHLLEQVGTMRDLDPALLPAIDAIVHNLDHRGYLDATEEQLVEESGCDIETIEAARAMLMRLEPLGCASRDLSECLVVQAEERWPEDPNVARILRDHLRDLERRNYAQIARVLDQTVEDVVEYHRMIRRLDPRPGLPYADDRDHYITPDVAVEKIGGRWQIRQNEDGLPRLRVSRFYKNVLRDKSSRSEDRRYIKQKLEAADFLIKSIYKRQRTIYKVMNAILERQQEFFERGPEHLRPMILRDVADQIGVHESTVSRVTDNKYVQTKHGIFELKYFFNAAIQSSDGDDLAGAAVKQKIRKLIADENPKKPLSDSAIMKLLKADGVKIARRTVAKYREAMRILPSNKRKKMF